MTTKTATMVWCIGVADKPFRDSQPTRDRFVVQQGLAPATSEVEPVFSGRPRPNELHHSADAFSLFSLSGKGETQCRAQVVADTECYLGLCVVLLTPPKRSHGRRAGEDIKTIRCFWYIPSAMKLPMGCIASH